MVSAPFQKRLAAVVDLLSLGIDGLSVLGAKVSSKLFVTLGFVLLLHFNQRFRNNRTRRLKHPITLGATEPLEVRLLDPYQLARHCGSIRLRMSKTEQCL